MQSSTAKNIDPAQIPRPAPSALTVQVFETRREGTHSIPPSADAPIVVRDRGSAGPRFIRSSINMVPAVSWAEHVCAGERLPLCAWEHLYLRADGNVCSCVCAGASACA
jgi:hypothetical protein